MDAFYAKSTTNKHYKLESKGKSMICAQRQLSTFNIDINLQTLTTFTQQHQSAVNQFKMQCIILILQQHKYF